MIGISHNIFFFRDRERRNIRPPQRFDFADLIAYALVITDKKNLKKNHPLIKKHLGVQRFNSLG